MGLFRKNIRVSLNAWDFQKLVLGKSVEREGVNIILQDIGFDVMARLVQGAWAAAITDQEDRSVKK